MPNRLPTISALGLVASVLAGHLATAPARAATPAPSASSVATFGSDTAASGAPTNSAAPAAPVAPAVAPADPRDSVAPTAPAPTAVPPAPVWQPPSGKFRESSIAPRKPEQRFRDLTITTNPLTLTLITRIGVNIEFAPAPHHVLLVNPFYGDSTWLGRSGIYWRQHGFEAGYRFYSRPTGAHGGFVGPFVGWSKTEIDLDCEVCSNVGADTWLSFGVDGGYQWITPKGFTIGVGGGLSTVAVTEKSGDKERYVLPRLLFTLGYSP